MIVNVALSVSHIYYYVFYDCTQARQKHKKNKYILNTDSVERIERIIRLFIFFQSYFIKYFIYFESVPFRMYRKGGKSIQKNTTETNTISLS